jgi:hypothetical protein
MQFPTDVLLARYLDLSKSLNPFILERLASAIWFSHSLLKRKFLSALFEIAVNHLDGYATKGEVQVSAIYPKLR